MGVLFEPIQLLAEYVSGTRATAYHLGIFRGGPIMVSYLVLGEFTCVQLMVTSRP